MISLLFKFFGNTCFNKRLIFKIPTKLLIERNGMIIRKCVLVTSSWNQSEGSLTIWNSPFLKISFKWCLEWILSNVNCYKVRNKMLDFLKLIDLFLWLHCNINLLDFSWIGHVDIIPTWTKIKGRIQMFSFIEIL